MRVYIKQGKLAAKRGRAMTRARGARAANPEHRRGPASMARSPVESAPCPPVRTRQRGMSAVDAGAPSTPGAGLPASRIICRRDRAGTHVGGSPSAPPQWRRLGRRTRRVVRGGCWGHAPRWPARNRGHGVAARARMRASHWSIRTELMLHSTRRRRSSSERQPLALSCSWSATLGA